ncbi:MAG: hypothetical protein V2A77_05380 [Pseudomonadota bacterium]
MPGRFGTGCAEYLFQRAVGGEAAADEIQKAFPIEEDASASAKVMIALLKMTTLYVACHRHPVTAQELGGRAERKKREVSEDAPCRNQLAQFLPEGMPVFSGDR